MPDPTVEPDETSSASSLRALAKARLNEHLGLVVSVLLVLQTIYQVMVFANGNPETAQAIVQAQGSVPVLTGTLLEIVSGTLPVFAFTMVTAPLWRRLIGPSEFTKFQAWSIALFGVFLASASAAFSALLILAALVVVLWVTAAIAGRRQPDVPYGPATQEQSAAAEASERRMFSATAVPFAVLFLLFLLGNDPWLPRENLHFKDETVVGYVLTADSDEVVYISYVGKRLQRLPGEDLERREICEWRRGNGSFWDKRPMDLLSDDEGYPSCAREEDED